MATGAALQGIFARSSQHDDDDLSSANNPLFTRGSWIRLPEISFIPEEQLALSSPTDWISYVQLRVDGACRYIHRQQPHILPITIVRLISESGTYQTNVVLSVLDPNTIRLVAIMDIRQHEELYLLGGWYDHDTSRMTTDERIALFDNFAEEILTTVIPYLRMHAWRIAGSVSRLQIRLALAYFDDPQTWAPAGALVSFVTYSAWLSDLVLEVDQPAKRARDSSDPSV